MTVWNTLPPGTRLCCNPTTCDLRGVAQDFVQRVIALQHECPQALPAAARHVGGAVEFQQVHRLAVLSSSVVVIQPGVMFSQSTKSGFCLLIWAAMATRRDLISACDMRYAAEDAQFSIKEIDIGMAADVGTLQRLPRIVGDGMLRELAYTGRQFGAEEARSIGLVNRVYSDHQSLLARPSRPGRRCPAALW